MNPNVRTDARAGATVAGLTIRQAAGWRRGHLHNLRTYDVPENPTAVERELARDWVGDRLTIHGNRETGAVIVVWQIAGPDVYEGAVSETARFATKSVRIIRDVGGSRRRACGLPCGFRYLSK